MIPLTLEIIFQQFLSTAFNIIGKINSTQTAINLLAAINKKRTQKMDGTNCSFL